MHACILYCTNGMEVEDRCDILPSKKDSTVLAQYMYVCLYSAPKANARERNCIVFIVYENVCMSVCMYSAPNANARE